ncbi:MAG: type II CAAX endopeptidase family protein [Gemmatimonadota bacterium]
MAFFVVTAFVAAAVGLLLPPSILGGSVALLMGGTIGGWMLLAVDGRPPAALGFPVGRETAVELFVGTGLGTATALVAVALLTVAGGVVWSTEGGTVAGWLSAGAGALLFLVLPAAAEEVLLRGYLLQALAEAWGVGRALVLTSLVFALAHLGNPGITTLAVVNIGVAGLWLGVIWVRTGSLWWATGAHLGWNWGGAYVADLPVSGLELFDAPFYEARMVGPDWLGGGPFGPEGSVLATAVLGGATWWCGRTRRLKVNETVRAARPLVAIGTMEREPKEIG